MTHKITIGLILVGLFLTPLAVAKELKAPLLLTKDLNEWCMSSSRMKQQFCEAYLLGVYETTDCIFKQEASDYTALKTTFVTWVFAMKEDGFIYAVDSALAAFKRRCSSQ